MAAMIDQSEKQPISAADTATEFAEFHLRASELAADLEHLLDNFELDAGSFSHAKHIALLLRRAADLSATTTNTEGGAK